MIRFLLKGLVRDKNRSLLPIIVVSLGVALTVFLSGYVKGAMGGMIDTTARFDTGHVKVMTRAYAEDIDQRPNDLALLNVGDLTKALNQKFPQVTWVKRIRFSGLLDVPDEKGETLRQGPGLGMAIELFSGKGSEIERMNIKNSIRNGQIPQNSGEALMGIELAQKLKLKPNDTITYLGSTMNGSMTFMNFRVTGFVCFGSQFLDKSAVIIDISDAQEMLDMQNASGEILGFLKNDVYFDEKARTLVSDFNNEYFDESDLFSPIMMRLKELGDFAQYMDYVDLYIISCMGIFVAAMSVVLWNTGLLGGLRRYREFGIRLALGESKGSIFGSLITEALLIGTIGSTSGTIIGLAGTWILQVYGIDIKNMTANSTIMVPSVIYSKITPDCFHSVFFLSSLYFKLFEQLGGLSLKYPDTG